jgi:hypothetical protein
MPTTAEEPRHQIETSLENLFDDDDNDDGGAEMMLIDSHDTKNVSPPPMYILTMLPKD